MTASTSIVELEVEIMLSALSSCVAQPDMSAQLPLTAEGVCKRPKPAVTATSHRLSYRHRGGFESARAYLLDSAVIMLGINGHV